jgi:Domain of unknown function (DUF4440)
MKKMDGSIMNGQRFWQLAFVLTVCSIAVVITAAVTAATDQGTLAERDQAVLAQIQQTLAKAWVGGDRVTIERIIAPEWRSTGPDGRQSDRASVIAEVFEKRLHQIRRLDVDDVRVQLFGDAAVVTGRTHGVGEFAGAPYDVVIRFTDTFVRRNGQWHAVASHASVDSHR